MLNPASPLTRLLAAPMRAGTLVWIGLRPERRGALRSVAAATLLPGDGLVGDHYRGRPQGGRQVTLIGTEDLSAIASYLGRDRVMPEELRRNLLVSGINLTALKTRQFWIGAALLEWSGECHPCSRMEEILGVGGYNAVRGHGGITARVLAGGDIRPGDAVGVDQSPASCSGAAAEFSRI
jgi:MOSC domain-containing protein YiiM